MERSSVGGKGSGRRSGEAGTSWGGEEGTKRIITERVVKEKSGNPVIKKLDKALDEIDDIDVTDFFQIVFDSGADAILICRVVPNGEEFKVGTLKKGMPYPNEDVETFLLNSFGGPGTFLLKPAIKSPYGGLLRVSKNKRVRIGLSSESDAGMMGGINGDADSMITRVLAREDKMHALNKIQEINARSAGPVKGEDGMKLDEAMALVNAMKGNDKTSEILLEMLRNERADRAAQVAATQQKNPLEMLLPVMAPILGFLDKKLSPNTVTKWIEILRNPSPAVEPAETSLIGTLAGLAKDFMPYLQPMIQNAMQTMMTPAGQVPRHLAAVPAVAAAPTTHPQPGGDDVATREYDDADTKEVLDYVVTCLDSHKFSEAYAALRTCDDTVDAIAPIMPGAEPMAFYFRVKDLDERLRERKDTVLEFIGYIQSQIELYIKQQQAQQDPPAETAASVASTTPPAA
jgi:hypothetical protein